jgi:hypothetical protein
MLFLEISFPLSDTEDSGLPPKIYKITDALHCDQCDKWHQKKIQTTGKIMASQYSNTYNAISVVGVPFLHYIHSALKLWITQSEVLFLKVLMSLYCRMFYYR